MHDRPDAVRQNSLTIRQAGPEDAHALAPLSGQLGYPSTVAQISSRLALIFTASNQVVFVAESGGRVIGWVHAGAFLTVESDPSIEVRGLVVEQHHRGMGVGRTLMASVESWSRDRGFAAITLRSNIIRGDAHAFYQRLGYSIVKTQHAFRKQLL